MATGFEPQEYIRTLTAAGVPPAQAEAMARAHAKSLKSAIDQQGASKSDLLMLSGDIQQLGGEIKSELKTLRSELVSEMQSEIRGIITWLLFGLAFVAFIVILARIIR